MRRGFWLCFGFGLAVVGCGGVYISPTVNAPGLRESGQAHVSANMRIGAPHGGASLMSAYAITDLVRLGGSATASFAGSPRKGAYAELLGGVEPALSRYLQLGLLAGGGMGRATARHEPCETNDLSQDGSICVGPVDGVEQVSARYARYFAQGHLILRAKRAAAGGLGVRASLLDMRFRSIEGMPSSQQSFAGTVEPFLFVRVGSPRIQFEGQWRFVKLVHMPTSQGRGLIWPEVAMFTVGLRVVLGPSCEDGRCM